MFQTFTVNCEIHASCVRQYLLILHFFMLFLNCLLFIFGCSGSFLLCVISLVATSRGYSLAEACISHCSGFSYCRALALSTQVSVVEAHNLICPKTCGIFSYQESNLCSLHWQAVFCFVLFFLTPGPLRNPDTSFL